MESVELIYVSDMNRYWDLIKVNVSIQVPPKPTIDCFANTVEPLITDTLINEHLQQRTKFLFPESPP
jgi:hypothetical protein